MRDQLRRTRLCGLTMLVAGGLVVSGIALTVSALGARALFGRGSGLAAGFAATVVIFGALAAGRAVPMAVIRILAEPQRTLQEVRSSRR